MEPENSNARHEYVSGVHGSVFDATMRQHVSLYRITKDMMPCAVGAMTALIHISLYIVC